MTAGRWFAADEAAVLLDRSVARVYVLAHRHGWRRIVHKGRTFYHPSDVRYSLNRLTRPPPVKDPDSQVGGVCP